MDLFSEQNISGKIKDESAEDFVQKLKYEFPLYGIIVGLLVPALVPPIKFTGLIFSLSASTYLIIATGTSPLPFSWFLGISKIWKKKYQLITVISLLVFMILMILNSLYNYPSSIVPINTSFIILFFFFIAIPYINWSIKIIESKEEIEDITNSLVTFLPLFLFNILVILFLVNVHVNIENIFSLIFLSLSVGIYVFLIEIPHYMGKKNNQEEIGRAHV